MEILQLGIAPIPGDTAAGADIRSHLLFEQITGEIDKRTTLTGGVTNWNRVVDLAREILANYSKDILVCSYLNVGLLNTQGMKGLEIGLQIYHDLVLNYWNNGLYPPRINGRVNAISWWADNISEQLHKTLPEGFSSETKVQFEKNFTELIDFLAENGVGDLDQLYMLSHASMALIVDNTTQLPVNLDQPEGVSPYSDIAFNNNEPAISDQQTSPVKSFTPSEVLITVDNDLEKSLNSALQALSKISTLIASEQQLSYKFYKINRFIAWLDINVVPPFDTEYKTMLPAPDEHFQQLVKNYYYDNNWLELIKVAEVRVVDFRFWLDLSFYVYTSLTNISQQAAANEVSGAVVLLVKRLRGIEKLLFSDGTPFAIDETREWISSLISCEVGFNNAVSGSLQNTEELAVELNEANELAKQGKVLVAIDFLHQKIIASTSIQIKFLRILQFCQYSSTSGYGQLAGGYVNEILEMINNYNLESWDPVMAINGYKLILNTVRQKKAIEINESVVSNILSRLAIIDPVAALGYY